MAGCRGFVTALKREGEKKELIVFWLLQILFENGQSEFLDMSKEEWIPLPQ